MLERYEHHGREVHVISEVKGMHRAHCLCYLCGKYKGHGPYNCIISNRIYETCRDFGVVTPIYECPEFKDKP